MKLIFNLLVVILLFANNKTFSQSKLDNKIEILKANFKKNGLTKKTIQKIKKLLEEREAGKQHYRDDWTKQDSTSIIYLYDSGIGIDAVNKLFKKNYQV